MTQAHFSPALFEFLTELQANNNREWFQANKKRYERDVKEPLLAFIADFSAPLAAISPRFVADPRPNGGSMFRIFRDVRFSTDKRPYKTHAAAQFRHHRGRDVHAPGFYLHLEPGSVFAGCGLWHPDGATLKKLRTALVDNEGKWVAVRDDVAFRAHHTLGGESLKRVPRGFDPGHPLAEDLMRKDFVASQELSVEHAVSAGFLELFVESCQAASSFMRFLTEAVELAYD